MCAMPRAPWAARPRYLRAAATGSTSHPRNATTETCFPAMVAMAFARSSPTGNVPPRGPATDWSSAATRSSARARCATTATPSTTMAAIPPVRFRTPATSVSPDNPAPSFPSVATGASKRARSATTAIPSATMAAAALVNSKPGGSAWYRARPASRLLTAAMESSSPHWAKCATTATRRTTMVVLRTARPRVRGVSAHRGNCASARLSSAATALSKAASSATTETPSLAMAARGPARLRQGMPVPSPMPHVYQIAATALCSNPWSNAIPPCRGPTWPTPVRAPANSTQAGPAPAIPRTTATRRCVATARSRAPRAAMTATPCPTTVVHPPATRSRIAARPRALVPRSAGTDWSSTKGATMATPTTATVARRLAR